MKLIELRSSISSSSSSISDSLGGGGGTSIEGLNQKIEELEEEIEDLNDEIDRVEDRAVANANSARLDSTFNPNESSGTPTATQYTNGTALTVTLSPRLVTPKVRIWLTVFGHSVASPAGGPVHLWIRIIRGTTIVWRSLYVHELEADEGHAPLIVSLVDHAPGDSSRPTLTYKAQFVGTHVDDRVAFGTNIVVEELIWF